MHIERFQARPMSLKPLILQMYSGGYMPKKLINLLVAFAIAVGFFTSQAALACTTQTLIVGGKMTVCTVCGTVVSCM